MAPRHTITSLAAAAMLLIAAGARAAEAPADVGGGSAPAAKAATAPPRDLAPAPPSGRPLPPDRPQVPAGGRSLPYAVVPPLPLAPAGTCPQSFGPGTGFALPGIGTGPQGGAVYGSTFGENLGGGPGSINAQTSAILGTPCPPPLLGGAPSPGMLDFSGSQPPQIPPAQIQPLQPLP